MTSALEANGTSAAALTAGLCGPAGTGTSTQALGHATLRRHRLAHPDAAAWAQVLRQAPDAQALACLRHWAEHDLPLVVRRQPMATARAPDIAWSAVRRRGTAPAGSDSTPRDGLAGAPLGGSEDAPLAGLAGAPLALGLAAPAVWGRRPLSLRLPAARVARWAEFPDLAEVCALLPAAAQPALAALAQRLAAAGLSARAYGSAGWQCLSGLAYLHPQSDLDLWLAVADADQADAAAAALQGAAPPGLTLDGELVFPDGAAVAWREWAAWRAGRTQHLLVKRLRAVALAATLADLGLAEPVPADITACTAPGAAATAPAPAERRA